MPLADLVAGQTGLINLATNSPEGDAVAHLAYPGAQDEPPVTSQFIIQRPGRIKSGLQLHPGTQPQTCQLFTVPGLYQVEPV